MTLVPPIDYPPDMPIRVFARSDFPRTSGLVGQAARGLQHVRAYRRKLVFYRSADLTSAGLLVHGGDQVAAAEIVGGKVWYPFYCLTGYGATHLRFTWLVAPPGFGGGATGSGSETAVDPSCWWTERIGPNAGDITDVARAPATYEAGSTAGAVDPNRWAFFDVEYPVEGNTFYAFDMTAYDRWRPIAVAVYEIAETVMTAGDPAVAQSDFGYRDPMLASHVQSQQEAATKLWKKNAAPLWVWTRPGSEDGTGDNVTAPPSVTGTTFTNIHDNSTARTVNTVGLTVDLENMDSLRGDGVPCRLWVTTSVDDITSTGEVKLVGAAGDIVTIGGIDSTVPRTYVEDFLVTALTDRYDIHARCTGAGDIITVHAVGLMQYCHERSFPDRADQWDNWFPGVGRRPQSLWGCQDANTATQLEDNVGAVWLDNNGTSTAVTFGVTPTVPDPFRSLAVQIDDGGYLEAVDGVYMDAPDDVSGALRVYIPSSPAADVGLFNKQAATGTAGYHCYVESTNGNISLVTDDGTSSVTSTVAEDFRGRWVDIVWAIDVTNDEQRIWAKGVIAGSTTVKGSDSDSIAALGSLTNLEIFSLGGGGGAGVPTAQSQLYSWVCVHDNYALTDTDRDIIVATDFIAQEGRVSP